VADPTPDLEKLAELHANGVITDEEFAAKKKQILGL
jgi:putative oligomerization/nucleic acid binding protein